jgi:hypothetical protein
MSASIETFTETRAARSVSLRCRLFGHKVPAWRRFLLNSGSYQRCTRCGERVAVKNR